jgi:hypothetical protein
VRYQAALRPDRMKQGDFHSNRFSPHRDFVGLDSDFSLSILRPVSGINSPAPSLGELKKLLLSLLRKPKCAGANLVLSSQCAPVFTDAGAHSLLGRYVRSTFVRDLTFALLINKKKLTLIRRS